MKRLMTFESYSILGQVENIIVSNDNLDSVECKARINTGSYYSRISSKIAKDLKLPVIDNIKINSPNGDEKRTFVELQFNINGIEIKTIAGISDSNLSTEISIGRKDIELVNGIVDIKKKNNYYSGNDISISNILPEGINISENRPFYRSEKLPLSRYPRSITFTINGVKVEVKYRRGSSEEIKREVIEEIGDRLTNINGLEKIIIDKEYEYGMNH